MRGSTKSFSSKDSWKSGSARFTTIFFTRPSKKSLKTHSIRRCGA